MITRERLRNAAISCVVNGILVGIGLSLILQEREGSRPIHTSLIVFLACVIVAGVLSVRSVMRLVPADPK